MASFWHTLSKPFFVLAPMDGATDVVFRQVVEKAARPDVYYTEFTNAASYYSEHGRPNALRRLRIAPGEKPVVAQIWGTNPEHYAFMARDLKKLGFAGIDINMGCPAKDVVKTGACSALIQTPALAAELIAAAKEGGLPVSVKTRIGFKSIITEEWLGFLLQQNIDALIVHGRTQREMSKVPAHWDEIAKAVKLRDQVAPHTVLIGNGDVMDRQEGLQRVAETGVDGIMIGRGIFNDPFCFQLATTPHTKEELLALLHYHLNLFETTNQGQYAPFAPLKRFFKIYIRNFDGASELRAALMETNTLPEAREILRQYDAGSARIN